MLISQLPDILQNVSCAPDLAMDLIFEMKYIPNSFVSNLMEILIIKQIPPFFRHPVLLHKSCLQYKNVNLYVIGLFLF